jgi:hypothetical protein
VTDFERLLQALAAGGVEYILSGGLAGNAHGAIRTTRDVAAIKNLKIVVTFATRKRSPGLAKFACWGQTPPIVGCVIVASRSSSVAGVSGFVK